MRFSVAATLDHRYIAGLLILCVAIPKSACAAGLGDLPQCAQASLLGAIGSSSCPLTDRSCICGDATLLQRLQTAVSTSCSTADQQKTQNLALEICPNLYAGEQPFSSAAVPSQPGSIALPSLSSSAQSSVNPPVVSSPPADFTVPNPLNYLSLTSEAPSATTDSPTYGVPPVSYPNGTNSTAGLPEYEGGAVSAPFLGLARVGLTVLSMAAMALLFSEL